MIDIDQIGPYKIHAELGSGGTSVVHQATDTRDGQEIALKILKPYVAHDPSFLRRFVEEGRNAQRLDHPNIVKILNADEADGFHFIAMELVSGGTLLETLKKRARLIPTEEAIDTLKQIAAGLDYAHTLEILHRDIKLSNILLAEDGRALISDFGSAKRMTTDATLVTQIGFSIGTPTFMSPEQAKGIARIDQRSDIYSLGVVAYTLLTGKLPFQAENPLALLHKIVYEQPPLPQSINPQLAPGIDHALQRVLRKEPDARYETAELFIDALTNGQFEISTDVFNGQTVQELYNNPQSIQKPAAESRAEKRSGFPNYLYLILLAAAMSVGLVFIPILFNGQNLRNSIIAPQESERLPTPTVQIAPNNTNQPVQAAETANTEENISRSPKPIVLSPYEDENNHYTIYIPTDWQVVKESNTVHFSSPELPVNIFVQSIDNSGQTNTPAAIIRKYLYDEAQNYNDLVFLDGYGRLVGTLDAYEQVFSALSQITTLQGTTAQDVFVQLRLTVVTGVETNFIIGSIVDKSVESSLSAVINAVTDSFSLIEATPAALTEPATGTATLSPTLTKEATALTNSTPTIVTASATAATLSTTPTASPTVQRVTIDRIPTKTGTAMLTKTAPTTTTLPISEAIALLITTTPAINATTENSEAKAIQRNPTRTDKATTNPTVRSTNTPRPRTPTINPSASISLTVVSIEQPTNTPTQSQSPTRTRTPIVRATATIRATTIPTNTPTQSQSPTRTRTPIVRATATIRATTIPTDTPTQTQRPTRTQTSVPPTPTEKPTSTPADTPRPTNTIIPTLVPTQVSTAVPTINTGSVQLNLPANNADGNGTQRFQWASTFVPLEGQGFELIFWKPNEDPIINGFGLASPTKELQVTVDLDKLDTTLEDLLEPGTYRWGVLLVNESPYTRLRYLGGGNIFTFERSRSSSRQPATGE